MTHTTRQDDQHEQAADKAPEDLTPAAVLATRRTLRTGLMWVVVGAIVVGIGVTLALNPKAGAYYFALVLAIVGTVRLVLPGAPFGISARERWVDVVFSYGLSAAIFFLASTSYALRCTEGLFC